MTTGSDKTIKLWNPVKGLLLKKYEGHHSDVLCAVSSHDNSNIVSGSSDKSVILWDVTESEPVRRIRGHYGDINCVAFNADSSVALSGSTDHSVRVWDMRSRSKEPVQVLDEARDSITGIAVSGHEIVTGSLDQKVRRYDLRAGVMNMDDVKASVSNVCFTRDGQCILCSCLNSSVKLVDKETGDILQEFYGHLNNKFRVDGCLLNNDQIVLSGSEDGHVFAWSLTQVMHFCPEYIEYTACTSIAHVFLLESEKKRSFSIFYLPSLRLDFTLYRLSCYKRCHTLSTESCIPSALIRLFLNSWLQLKHSSICGRIRPASHPIHPLHE